MNETTETLEGLEAERARLALDVAEGLATLEELERVEGRIQALRRDEERRGLAERERSTRNERQQTQRATEERARLEAEHARNHELYRGAAWEVGSAVMAARERVGVAALLGPVTPKFAELGQVLESVRGATAALLDASTVALASAEKLGASRLPYARTNTLLRGYFLARLGRRATELLVGPVEAAEKPGKDLVASLVDFFEGTR